jgi:hypothetical protein
MCSKWFAGTNKKQTPRGWEPRGDAGKVVLTIIEPTTTTAQGKHQYAAHIAPQFRNQ